MSKGDELTVVPSEVEGQGAQGRPEHSRGTTGLGSSRAASKGDELTVVPSEVEVREAQSFPEQGRNTPRSGQVAEPVETPQPVPAVVAPPASRAGLGRRELLLIAVAVAVAGLITLGLLSARGSSPAVAAARVEAPAKKPSAPAGPPPASPVVSQKWSSENGAYWVGKQRHAAAFELPAENMVSIWMNQVRPALIVRCMSKSLEVFVFTGSAIKMEAQTEDHTVSFKFDDEPDRTERWPDSAEHDALFAPDQAAFANRLMSARTLRFGYTPHNAEPAVAQFHVSGLAELIEPFAKVCGTKK